jgi:hypothetical protein
MLLFHGMKRELERVGVDEPLVEGEEASQGFGVGEASGGRSGFGVKHVLTVLLP